MNLMMLRLTSRQDVKHSRPPSRLLRSTETNTLVARETDRVPSLAMLKMMMLVY